MNGFVVEIYSVQCYAVLCTVLDCTILPDGAALSAHQHFPLKQRMLFNHRDGP